MTPERQEHLNEVAIACTFDDNLRGSGNSHLIWSGLSIFIGIIQIKANNLWGLINLGFGLGLLGSGLYLRRARDPKVIKISAVALAGLAVWNLGGIALMAMGITRVFFGFHVLVAGIMQAIGAYSTWQSYEAYVLVHEKLQDSDAHSVREALRELQNTNPKKSAEIVEMRYEKFSEATVVIRLRTFEDGIITAYFKEALGRLKEPRAAFWNRQDIRVDNVEGKMLSSKKKVTLHVGPEELKKVEISSEMLERLETTLSGMRLASSSVSG